MDQHSDPADPTRPQPLTGPPPPESAPPGPPPPGPAATDLGRGWRIAVLRAVLTAVALLLLAQAVVLVAYVAADDSSKPSLTTAAEYGGVLFYVFHHVGIRFDVPPGAGSEGDVPFNVSAGGVIAIAAMAGTALALWLLYLGGRAVAREVGGSTLARGLHGLKVAPPYAALVLLGSFLVRFRPEDVGLRPDDVQQLLTIHPSYLGALLWPLALAAVAGFTGGVRSEHPEGWTQLVRDREGLGRRLHGALLGGWRMIVYGLVFSFAGLLVMAVVKPDATAEYFSSFDRGVLDGVLAILGTLLVLPNMAAWVLFPAMGSCLGLSGPLSICFLSYWNFPGGTTAIVDGGAGGPAALNLPSAPPGYFLFLLVPLAAVIVGGMAAARKGRALSRNDAAALGAMAGVVFAVLSLLTIILASITFKISGNLVGFAANGSFRIGPGLTSGVLLALLWGVVGGALGGLWEGRALPPRVVAAPTAPPPEQPSATPEAPLSERPADRIAERSDPWDSGPLRPDQSERPN